MTEQNTEKSRWDILQEIINRRFAEKKAARYVGEIVYQEEGQYFEQIVSISSNKVSGTDIFLVQCVDANQQRDAWRVEYTTIEARPQDTSRFFRSEIDARIMFEMLEAGKYVSALEFAHRCFLQAMGIEQPAAAEPTEEEEAMARQMEEEAYDAEMEEAELQADTILAQQELEDFENAGVISGWQDSINIDDFDPFGDIDE